MSIKGLRVRGDANTFPMVYVFNRSFYGDEKVVARMEKFEIKPPFLMYGHVLIIWYFHLLIYHFHQKVPLLSLRDFPLTRERRIRSKKERLENEKCFTCFRRLRESDADSRFLIIRRCFFNASSYSIAKNFIQRTKSMRIS